MNIAIIDISRMLYIICARNEGVSDFSIHKDSLDNWIEETLDFTEATHYIICGDGGCFRRDILPEFKADRKGKEPPTFLKELRDYCTKKWNLQINPMLEADDLVLINYNYYTSKGNLCTICTGDSDLQQNPGNFYNPTTKNFKIVSKDEAELNLWSTVLAGGHNGLKVLKRCGAETTKKYLSNYTPDTYYLAVVNAYIKGIEKHDDIKVGISGLGFVEGFGEFYKNFVSSYLLKTREECDYNNIEDYVIIEPTIRTKLTLWK